MVNIYSSNSARGAPYSTYFIIPVSLDYGAEEYLWHSHFIAYDDVMSWWLRDFDLSKFERRVQQDEDFYRIDHKNISEEIEKLFNESQIRITIIDAMDNLSYIVYGKQKVFKDGTSSFLK